MNAAQMSLLFTALCLTSLVCVVHGGNACYPQTCGYLNITYPFQVEGSSCGNSNFTLKCKENATFGEGKIPFLATPTGEYQILNLSFNFVMINVTHLKAISCSVSERVHKFFSLPESGPFTIAGINVFASVGCYTSGSFFSTTPQSNNSRVGGECTASCLKIEDPGYCNGFGCCQTTFMENWRTVSLSAQPYAHGGCVFSTILDPTTFWVGEREKGVWGKGTYALKVDWGVNESCSAKGPLSCSKNADCVDITCMPGYRSCRCKEGYQGDGYEAGVQCTDIDECSDPTLNNCHPSPLGRCVNSEGSFKCLCNGKSDGRNGCIENPSIVAPLLIGILSSLVAGPLIAGAIFWVVKKRRQIIERRKYFRQNGGLLLQEYISSDRGRRKATIFSEAELARATNNFSEDHKIGAGGFGYVYHGRLAEGRSVAIKKCKEVDQERIDQFINEVIILSQIDHRNVIKLLGFCLETRIPLLVYEYVSNGTLSDHLHGKDFEFLSWNRRLQIAIETAEAVAYLHSSASVPIVHRDIKSANILLDSTCSPKLSDFGLSRLVPTDNSHLTTDVKGTFGYLDPKYFLTVQLTDKTDVYSFGVLMVELLTGMKPLSTDRAKEDRNLTYLFLSRKSQGLLGDIIDGGFVQREEGGEMECMRGVANLAEACLSMDVERRPSMKEVVQELLWIRGGKVKAEHSWLQEVDSYMFSPYSACDSDADSMLSDSL